MGVVDGLGLSDFCGMHRGGSVLEIDGVELSFGGRAVLGGLYLRVEAGRVTGLLGCNGCGKSSLMSIMHGTMEAAGSLRIDGAWVAKGYKNGVMMAPQHSFSPAGRLVRNVLRDYGVGIEELERVFPSFARFANQPMAMLSGGERRVIEVFAMLNSPLSRFCLLDEPFAQLSPLVIDLLKQHIAATARCGKGILLSDHLYRDVCEVADDLYIIADRTVRKATSDGDLQRFGYIK